MKTVSLHPLVFCVDGFLFDEECQYIREQSEPYLAQSGVALMDQDKGKAATDWRTSSTYFFKAQVSYCQGTVGSYFSSLAIL